MSAIATNASAQAPNEKWRTVETPHFHVHFAVGLESVARRAGGSAERAYDRLAPLLHAPRGRIDLVVTDHADYSNGFAYVSPSPRIVIFARPPVDDRTLRFRDDWLDLVVQHELVHVFQLDRTRGWWRLAQGVFGRQPLLFPNAWAPSWLLEGLAVYYESKLGDGGRLEGMSHVPYVNAAAADGRLPRFGEWSVASLDFPGGTNAYIYGSLFVQSLSAKGGAGSVERFVERSSGRWIPWSFERAARRDFGTSMRAQWAVWSDSVMKSVRGTPAATDRALTTAAWLKRFPRVAPDGRVLYVASDGRDVTGLYALPATLTGAPHRVARRNSLEPNVPLSDGRIVFAQWDWRDPWRLRSDLWVREADGREHALTHDARLFAPDARASDGAIVAAQNVEGGTRLVLVAADGGVTPITVGHLDANWSAPRWSHDGTRIAAVRWTRGGLMSIVVMSAEGKLPRDVTVPARAVVDAPSWTADDHAILFSYANPRTGVMQVARVDLSTDQVTLGETVSTSLDSPEALGAGYVAVETRAAGERLVQRPSFTAPATTSGALPGLPDQVELPAATSVSGAIHSYRPLRQLVPRYWLPSIETSDENKTRYGALVSGSDIVDRHFYAATVTHEPERGENTGSFVYRYAGLGQPFIDLAARQTWDHSLILDQKVIAGTLARRRRYVGASLTLFRPRVRNSAILSGGAELELRDFTTDPESLLGRLGSPLFLRTLKYPTFHLLTGWSNTRTPILALGPEDGLSVAGSARWRWRTDDASATRSATYIGAASVFKSLPFPGRAHHVLALRGVAGVTDDRTNSELEAGGASGTSVELAPGLVVGDVRRNFFVRGFTPGAQRGIRALGGSAEWRAPVAIPSWGSRFIPFFAQRVSATLFGDAGAAWCPAGSASGTIGCPSGPTPRTWMTSVGAELMLDAAVLSYDVPYRLRLGWAQPVQGRAYADHPDGSIYFSLGATF